jgi:hypothetical protein
MLMGMRWDFESGGVDAFGKDESSDVTAVQTRAVIRVIMIGVKHGASSR